MRPGYRVPPVTLPRGCHVPVGVRSQFVCSCMLRSRLRGVDGLTVIEPIPKAIEAMLHEIFGSSEIEPWVKFMNNTLEPND